MLLPETNAQKLLVEDGVVRGVRTGDKGLGATATSRPTTSRAPRSWRRPRCWRRAAGPPDRRRHRPLRPAPAATRRSTRSASRRCGRSPGRSTASSTRSAGRCERAPGGRSSAARGIYATRWATTRHLRSASWSGSTTRRAAVGRTTCCRSSRRTRWCAAMLEGGERVAWGAKAIPEGGYWALPELRRCPARSSRATPAGMVNVPKLKGVHYALRSGMLAADTIYTAAEEGLDLASPTSSDVYDRGRGSARSAPTCTACAT